MDDRTSIPADLKRKILVEAGHRCAIPTCRSIIVEVHHIMPWEKCKKHEYNNLITLCPNCHRRADNGEIDKKSLRMYKNNLRFLYDRFTTFEIDVLFELNKMSKEQAMQFPSFLILLIKRIIEEGYVDWIKTSPGVSISHSGKGPNVFKLNPDYLKITEEGREFVKSLNSEDVGY